MRRLLAALSLLTLANLVFVLGGSACPLAGTTHVPVTTVSGGDHGHEGHDMSAHGPSVTESPGDDVATPPVCLTMGPCALTLDLAIGSTTVSGISGVDRVLAVSDHLPPSAALIPELPPPRA
jgi:hypothetical protein